LFGVHCLKKIECSLTKQWNIEKTTGNPSGSEDISLYTLTLVTIQLQYWSFQHWNGSNSGMVPHVQNSSLAGSANFVLKKSEVPAAL